MSCARFESLLEERGFQKEKSRAVVNMLFERQYLVAKSILLDADAAKTQIITEGVINESLERLFKRRNIYPAQNREDMSGINARPLGEVKHPGGPPADQQLKHVLHSVLGNSAATTTTMPLLEVDEGPQEDTVFSSLKSSKGAVEVKSLNGEDDENSRKRSAPEEEEDERKRIKI